MDERLKALAAKVLGAWKALGKKKRRLLIGAAAGLAVILTVVLVAVNTTRYAVLFSGLSDSESGQVVTQLKTMGVAYKTDGSTIYVDASKADEARMQLAEDGLPQTTLTYGTYSGATSWAMTDSDKQRLALYQVQDRLQDTIKTIPGVKSAEVTIGQSSDTDYVLSSDKVPVTASVKLNLTPGETLTQKQVQGIVLLVSHSYADLSKDNVTVLDSDGTSLTDNSSEDSGTATENLKLQTDVESLVKSKVLAVLRPVFGGSNVQVAAGATLDFSQKTTSTTTYSGANQGQGVISSQQKSSSSTSTGTGTAGTTGVNSGQPTYPTTSSSSVSTGSGQASETTNYLVNSVNEQVKSQGASLKKLTVAVLLNSQNQAAATSNISSVKETVAYAVGISPNDISVQMVPFSANKAASQASSAAQLPLGQPLLLALGAAALVLAAAVVLLIRLIAGRRRKKRMAQMLAEQEKQQQDAKAAAKKQEELPSIEEEIEGREKNTLKKQINDFADKKPELVAQLLKNWLKD